MDCLDCKICNVPYDEEDHRPRNSRCGHEICTACLKALINNGTFMCPKCRMTSEVNHPDDLSVNFGLIDVIRAFKRQNISSTQKSEVCYEHLKDIKHRCLRCETWICEECLDWERNKHTNCNHSMFHIISATKAMSDMKEKHTEDIKSLITCYIEKAKNGPSLIQDYIDRIQELTDKGEGTIQKAEKQKKEIMDSAEKQCKEIMEVAENHKEELFERAKKLNEEMEKIYNLFELGNKHKEKLIEWDSHFQSTSLSYRMLDNTEMLTEIQQLMKRCLQSLEAYTTIPMLELNPMIHEASLIFLELSLGNVVKGRVVVRLTKKHPKIRENMVAIVTGNNGKSLAGTELGSWSRNELRTCSNLPFSDIPITPAEKRVGGWGRNELRNCSNLPFSDIPITHAEKRLTTPEEKCNIVGYYGEGYLRIMYLSTSQRHSGSSGQYPIGYIESGSDILKECNQKLFECHESNSNCECKPHTDLCNFGHSCVYLSKRCMITSCGLIIEKQE